MAPCAGCSLCRETLYYNVFIYFSLKNKKVECAVISLPVQANSVQSGSPKTSRKSPIHYYCNMKRHYLPPLSPLPSIQWTGLVSRSNSIIHIIPPHTLHRRLHCSQRFSSSSPRPALPTLDKHDNSDDQERKTPKGASRHSDNHRNVRTRVRRECVRRFRLRGCWRGASGGGGQG